MNFSNLILLSAFVLTKTLIAAETSQNIDSNTAPSARIPQTKETSKQCTKQLTKPKAVIFDWDNTLADTWNSTHEILNHTLVTLGKCALTIEETKADTHLSARELFPKLFGDKSDEAFKIADDYVQKNAEKILEKLKLTEGALDLLKFLEENKIPCIILSNKAKEYLQIEVDHLKLASFFQGIYGSGDFKCDKPDPYPAKEILSKYKLSADDTWLVGDTEADWQCALRSGCVPIAISEKGPTETLPFTFKSCAEILEALKEVMN